jgi:hypothetical protein
MLYFRHRLSVVAGLSLCFWPTGVAFSETVSVTKDCLTVPCTVTGTTTPIGYFRTTSPSFNWEATYTGTPTQGHRFWVSQTGANMATIELTTNPGDIQGVATLAQGIYYISIRTALMGPGGYSVYGPGVHGDPHITTTNGVHYDFQGVGEFVMLKHLDSYEVQTRTAPVATAGPAPANPHTGLSTCVSINTAAAVRAGKQRITYQPNATGQPDPAGLQLRVDGVLVTGVVNGMTLNDGTRIWKNAQTRELRVQHRDYTGVRITPHWWASQNLWYLDIDMTPPPVTAGVAGVIPPDGWLPALADGTSMGAKPADLKDRYTALYVKFADSWRVNDTTTLFGYSPGTSTKTYSMPAWPGQDGKCELPFTVPVSGVSIDVAEQTCKGILSPRLKRFCVFDVMVTGNKGFGRSYAVAQGLPVVRARSIEAAKR